MSDYRRYEKTRAALLKVLDTIHNHDMLPSDDELAAFIASLSPDKQRLLCAVDYVVDKRFRVPEEIFHDDTVRH